jgi:dihydrofolate reductase
MHDTVLLTLVAAMDANRVIGAGNTMPWHLPADLAHFKQLTLGKTLAMGRKTFDSVGRALPGRNTLVITREPGRQFEGCTAVESVDAAIRTCASRGVDELMIAGGAQIYTATLASARRMHITRIDAELAGDTWFPTWDADAWSLTDETTRGADERNAYKLTFQTWDRVAQDTSK